jgi:methyl-accepting chemotaxis protein
MGAARSGLRFTVGRKLASLTAGGLLAALTIGITAVLGVQSINGGIQDRAELDQLRSQLGILTRQASDLQIDERNAVLVPTGAGNEDQASAVQKQFDGDLAMFQAARESLLTLPASAQNRAELQELATQVDAWLTETKAFIPVGLAMPPGSPQVWPAIQKRHAAGAKIQTSIDAVGTHLGEDAKNSQAAAASQVRTVVTTTVIILLVSMIALIGLSILITRRITRPLGSAVTVLGRVAQGDFTGSLALTSNDELGDLSEALDSAVGDVREAMSTIRASATALTEASRAMTEVAAQVETSSATTSEEAVAASSAAGQVDGNVQAVAGAAEQMAASIREIAQNSTQAARVAAAAVEAAQRTGETIDKLGDSSQGIAGVLATITSIAEQTNLLALNATIEAARAGEAGKGFAVVASEVKDLAQETARATGDISARIEAITADTADAVQAIASIKGVIEEIAGYQTTIASAVEEQTATTHEMSRSVAEAAAGTSTINHNISTVAEAAGHATEGAQATQHSAEGLSRLADELTALVGRFTI